MKKYCLWKDEEVVKLFRHIEEQVDNGICLSEAFKSYAHISQRKPNSVRNYYYAELSHLENNENRRNKFGIDLNKHRKIEPKYFSQSEIDSVLEEILKLYNRGYSIRKACYQLANQNIDEMVRLQNKYRTVLKNNPEKIRQIESKLINEGKIVKQTKLPSNVISMPSRKTKLSDNDINSLFLGLVKLIKNNAKQELNGIYEKQTQLANEQLRKTMVSLAEKEKQIAMLRKNFEIIKNENQVFEKKIFELRTENAKLQEQKSEKRYNSLKNYSQKMEKKKTMQ